MKCCQIALQFLNCFDISSNFEKDKLSFCRAVSSLQEDFRERFLYGDPGAPGRQKATTAHLVLKGIIEML